MGEVIGDIGGGFLNGFINGFQDQILGLANFLVTMLNDMTIGFFENESIGLLLNFSDFLNLTMFAISAFIVIVDIAEEKSTGNPVEWGTVFTNALKAFAFSVMAKWVAILTLDLANKVTHHLGYALSFEAIQSAYGDWSGNMGMVGINSLVTVIFFIILIITCVKFMIESLRRFSSILIQIFQVFIYIPSIMRGDTIKMGDWGRQTFSIILTYIFTYIVFFAGAAFLTNGDMLLCIAMWLAMSVIPKLLSHFGWQTGSTGNFGSMLANLGAQFVLKGK